MENFTEFELKRIESSKQNDILKNIDMPEISRNIYRDYIILWKDLNTVSEKYRMPAEKIRLIISNIATLIGDYEKEHMTPVTIPEESSEGDVEFD